LVSDDPWASYARTVVEFSLPDGVTRRVRASPVPDADEADWPWPDRRPVYVLTAWDPGAERPGREVNRARQKALEEDVGRLDCPFSRAVGVDPVTGRRDEGVAVRGAPEADVLALGARYGQDAVFAWTPREWAVVACLCGRRLESWWSVERPEPGFRFSQPSDVPI
jgi:hypothetical protein